MEVNTIFAHPKAEDREFNCYHNKEFTLQQIERVSIKHDNKGGMHMEERCIMCMYKG